VREQTVPVVPVVQAARAGAVRAALVTTSMRQRSGCKDAPENNLEDFRRGRSHHTSLL